MGLFYLKAYWEEIKLFLKPLLFGKSSDLDIDTSSTKSPF